MTITINGSGTIGGLSSGGLPDGSVTAADIESSLDLSGKTVTLPSGVGGKVLQVVQSTTTTSTTTTSGSYTDTALSASITPSSSSSKILVMVSTNCYANRVGSNTYGDWYHVLVRGSTELLSTRSAVNFGTTSWNDHMSSTPLLYLDSPATASSTTYKTQIKTSNASITYPQSGTTSVMTLMEIAG